MIVLRPSVRHLFALFATVGLLGACAAPSEPASVASTSADSPSAASTAGVAPLSVPDSVTTAAHASTTAAREPARGCIAADLGTRDITVTVTSDGVERTAVAHIPPGYDGATPTPLVIDFHGHGGNSRAAQRKHGFDSLADRDTVIMVYPQGLEQLDGLNGWSTGSPGRDSGTVDDVAFTRVLLDKLAESYCIDPARTFITGHSNGGGMTGLLACAAPTLAVAFAPVSGAFYAVPGGCDPGRAVPILEIHGTADQVVPYTGNARFGSIGNWLTEWSIRNGCTSSSIDGDRTTWSGCGAPLEHVALAGTGHEYPATANGLVWAFFTQLGL